MSTADTDTTTALTSTSVTVSPTATPSTTTSAATTTTSVVIATTSTTETTETVKTTETVSDTTSLTADEIAFNKNLDSAIAVVISKNKPKVAKSSFGTILKILQKIRKSPNDPKKKRVVMKNFAIQKNIIDVHGGLTLMDIIGFKQTEEKKKKCLVIKSIESKRLEDIIELLQNKIYETEDIQKKPKPAAARQRCKKDGCNFWGREEEDFYCSVCFKREKLGIGTTNITQVSKKCINASKGCNYYGSLKFNGKCSSCHKKEDKTPKGWKKKFRMAQIKLRAVHRFKTAPRLKQKNKKRCWQCNRKVGITGIECRCGYIFCGKCRYADEHDCQYDHKKRYVEKLKKELIKMNRKKVDTI